MYCTSTEICQKGDFQMRVRLLDYSSYLVTIDKKRYMKHLNLVALNYSVNLFRHPSSLNKEN